MTKGIPLEESKRRRAEREAAAKSKPGSKPYANGHDKEALPFFSFATASVTRWREQELEPMEFTVAELLPHLTAWLIGGDSGSGKSILMQTLCTCVAADKPFLGRAVRHGRAIYVTGEDRDDILHARQLRIFKALDLNWDDVGDNLLIRSVAEKEMWLFNERGPTPHGLALVDEITKLGGKTSVGVIDSASLTFDAEEIKRRPVADFMRYLNRCAVQIGGSIGLVAHTSRSSRGDARSMVSGSTAWVAQARAGLLLESADDGEAKLSLIAPNYSRRIEPIELVWNDDGVLLPKEAPEGVLASIQQKKHDEVVVKLIRERWDGEGDPIGRRALPGELAGRGDMKVAEAKAALARLTSDKRIETSRKPRGLSGLRLTSHEKNRG
jgi:RecA-family ATPase